MANLISYESRISRLHWMMSHDCKLCVGVTCFYLFPFASCVSFLLYMHTTSFFLQPSSSSLLNFFPVHLESSLFLHHFSSISVLPFISFLPSFHFNNPSPFQAFLSHTLFPSFHHLNPLFSLLSFPLSLHICNAPHTEPNDGTDCVEGNGDS